jgi:hypothetical protein
MHDSPIRLRRFESAVKHDPAVDRWFDTQSLNLGGMARPWFDFMRDLGDDVRDWHATVRISTRRYRPNVRLFEEE